MPSCNRVAAIWLFILACQLFQASITSTNMCRYVKHREVISVRDGYKCKQTKVKLGMCVGTCESHAIPIPLEGNDNVSKFQTMCQCCAPKDSRRKTVRFGAAGECEKSIVVNQIRSCECQNCSRRGLWEQRDASSHFSKLEWRRCMRFKWSDADFGFSCQYLD